MTRSDTGEQAAVDPARCASRDTSGDRARAEAGAGPAHCFDLVVHLLGQPRPAERIPHLARAAAGWAGEGIPLDAVLHAAHNGFQLHLDRLTASGARAAARVSATLDLLETVTGAITAAYVRDVTTADAGERADDAPVPARRYIVLAVHIPPPRDDEDGDRLTAHRTLGRLRGALAALGARDRLSPVGGTVLLPDRADTDLDQLLTTLGRATGVPLTATVVTVDRAEATASTDTAHRLLDVVTRLGYPPGLYRVDRMPMEVQLSAPGPARDHLAALLEPLTDHPDLLELLRAHFDNDLSRQRTAKMFAVHPNTVDHRLERITRLTGLDPASGDGAFTLQSALIARAATPALRRHREPADPAARSTRVPRFRRVTG